MRLIGVMALAFIAISTTTYSSSSKNIELKTYLDSRSEEIQKIATETYQYTFQPITINSRNCVAKESAIGTVGVCLITLMANEESVLATFAVTATSHYAGTGSTKPEIKLTLIDYEL